MRLNTVYTHCIFAICCVTALLTEEESRNRALELEQIADDGSTSAWSGWGGIDSSDVGKALAGLGIYGMPHQARGPKQSVLCPACKQCQLLAESLRCSRHFAAEELLGVFCKTTILFLPADCLLLKWRQKQKIETTLP